MLWGKRSDTIVRGQSPFNAEPPTSVLSDSDITALDAFYCRNHGLFPDIAPVQWRLTVNGLVAKTLTLTYDQLPAISAPTRWWRPWPAPATGAPNC